MYNVQRVTWIWSSVQFLIVLNNEWKWFLLWFHFDSSWVKDYGHLVLFLPKFSIFTVELPTMGCPKIFTVQLIKLPLNSLKFLHTHLTWPFFLLPIYYFICCFSDFCQEIISKGLPNFHILNLRELLRGRDVVLIL